MAEERGEPHVCERCGRVRASACDCGGAGRAQDAPEAPEGWDPEVTRSDRPRLGLVGRPEAPG